MNQRAIVREKDRCRIVVGYEAMLSTPTICWMIKEIVFAPFANLLGRNSKLLPQLDKLWLWWSGFEREIKEGRRASLALRLENCIFEDTFIK